MATNPNHVSLHELKPAQSAVIQLFAEQLQEKVRHRLLSLGLYPGASVSVLRRAPLGDPIQLRVDGMLVSLRREEAQHIIVGEVE